jgi:hypothetical protein
MRGTPVQISFEAVTEAKHLAVAFRRVHRKRIAAVRAGGLLVAAIAVLLWVQTDDTAAGVTALIGGLLVTAAYPILAERLFVRANAHLLGRPTLFRLDTEGVRYALDDVDDLIEWDEISGAFVLDDQVVVVYGRNAFLSLPTTGQPDATVSAVTLQLRDHSLLSVRPAFAWFK